ncbi:MAG TPA: ABC transporter permease [Streptosporangiaceae bacterium]
MRPGLGLSALRAGLTRHRIQTIVIALVALVSTGASVAGLALAIDSGAPFDHAFSSAHGADVAAVIDSARATQAELTASTRLAAVTAATGPFAEVTTTPRLDAHGGCARATPASPCLAPQSMPPMTLAGRASPGGPVDDLTLRSGHWATRPGQIVLSSADVYPDGSLPQGVGLGTQLTVTGAPGMPRLVVVGVAASATNSADGWVTPAEIGRLRRPGTPPSAQMLYRFASAGTAMAIRADVATVAAALPAGAVTGTQSYLTVRAQESPGITPIAPFLIAIGLIGVVMSALVVINVVSGAVVTGYRRIGILKSIGFTPGQVAAAYTGQAVAPAVAGALAGLALGNLLAAALLARAASAYQVSMLSTPAWLDVAVAATICGLAGSAALLPAIRAGRLSAIEAITAGRAPRSGRGFAPHRQLARLRLPRPVTMGLAAPFARPARTALTLAAVLAGATAVTLTAGLAGSLGRVVAGLSLTSTEQIQIQVPPGGPAGVVVTGHGHHHRRAQPLTVPAALHAQPGTLHYVAEADEQARVAGLTGQIPVTGFQGNAAWTGYPMISGHWYAAPGQADVPAGFLAATGTTIGDTVTLTFGGRQIPVRIVGEVFDSDNAGLAMITDGRTLARPGHPLAVTQYDIGLRPGTSPGAYAQALSSRLGPTYYVSVNNTNRGLPIVDGLIATLTLLLAAVAGLGVLNTVLLNTRERVHDLGVLKAVGMTPRQTIAMIVCSVTGTGLAAGAIAVPAGIVLQRHLVPAMAAAAGTGLPASFLDVYRGWELAALALAGTVIAVAGALPPAGWAAHSRTATALRTE